MASYSNPTSSIDYSSYFERYYKNDFIVYYDFTFSSSSPSSYIDLPCINSQTTVYKFFTNGTEAWWDYDADIDKDLEGDTYSTSSSTLDIDFYGLKKATFYQSSPIKVESYFRDTLTSYFALRVYRCPGACSGSCTYDFSKTLLTKCCGDGKT